MASAIHTIISNMLEGKIVNIKRSYVSVRKGFVDTTYIISIMGTDVIHVGRRFYTYLAVDRASSYWSITCVRNLREVVRVLDSLSDLKCNYSLLRPETITEKLYCDMTCLLHNEGVVLLAVLNNKKGIKIPSLVSLREVSLNKMISLIKDKIKSCDEKDKDAWAYALKIHQFYN